VTEAKNLELGIHFATDSYQVRQVCQVIKLSSYKVCQVIKIIK
jgi:hypothetical protein